MTLCLVKKAANPRHPSDHANKLTAHARARLLERLNCTHPVRHLNKVRKQGSLLKQNTERYTLIRNLEGNHALPVHYVFSTDGWLLTCIPKWRKGAYKNHKARATTQRAERRENS